jgi:hypothetical protein
MIVKLKRGTTALVGAYVGPAGSLVVDTQTNQVYVQDGVTAGGHLIGGLSEAQIGALIDQKVGALELSDIPGLTEALLAKANDSDLDALSETLSEALATMASKQSVDDLTLVVAGKAATADLFEGTTGFLKAGILPSYVDDVLEFPTEADFPAEGESGKIYVAADGAGAFRWTGTQYLEIVASPGSTDQVTEGAGNKYFTDERARQAISLDAASDAGLEYDAATGKLKYTAPEAPVLPVKATGAELIEGTDDAKFATAAGLQALLTDIGFTKEQDGSWTLDEGVLA